MDIPTWEEALDVPAWKPSARVDAVLRIYDQYEKLPEVAHD
jgi:hypothetical protein